ncbi:MAG: CfrBI family restriction endonuclease [Candidatus Cloacimonadota bacterium]|nr:MAG: CfrBI family restriction endonuclease [Candidatus Cloacimonadota bacterium]
MTLTETVVKNIIIKLIKGQDYRIEVVTLIDAEFLQYAIDFFRKVVDAKLKSQDVTIDWYKKELLNPELPTTDIAINSGLNMKTIENMYNSRSRAIVLEASAEHYETLYNAINSLVESGSDMTITLTIKLGKVSVDLDLNESLIVINTLAVKRAALRGGLWSTAGKRVEKSLMLTLCKLFGVTDKYYKTKILDKEVDPAIGFEREVDFYLLNPLIKEEHKCEVKLMGKGNPESADAVIARGSKVFVADKLSPTNKTQLSSLDVEWVELRSADGYKRFFTILKNLNIPATEHYGNIDDRLEEIFVDIFE